MIVIYHSKDLDGYCSGAICKHKYPDATIIGYDYGESFPWDIIRAGEEVIMIDVSLPMEDMEKLAARGHLTWIDHHKSAIEAFGEALETYSDGNLPYVEAVLEIGIAACEIAWRHFFPYQPMPLAVLLLGEYDTWRNSDQNRWDHLIMPFQYGMKLACSKPENFPAYLFDNDDHSKQGEAKILQNGITALAYQKQINENHCKAAFETTFLGKRAICLNNAMANSQVFASVYDPAKHDIMIPFTYTGKFWRFSIYSTKPDVCCSHLAKHMGGGGHKGAAGFQLDRLPEEFGGRR